MISVLIILLSCVFLLWLAFGRRWKNNGVGSFLSHRRISGLDGSDYLVRHYLLPRNKILNVYLHRFLGSDDDRALHDHPWYSVSCVLKGRLIEHRADGSSQEIGRGKITLRSPKFQHRIELPQGESATTLFITGPVVRTWGFICPHGWISWNEYGNKGGCE